MKSKIINHAHEEARIYKQNYRPSLNIFRVLKAILGIMVTGQSPSAHSYDYRRK